MNAERFENALVAWLRIGGDHTVILADQNLPEPSLPYISVRVGDSIPVGFDEDTVEENPEEEDPPHDQLLLAIGRRLQHVSVRAYTSETGGEDSAVAMLRRAIMRLGLPSVQALWDVAEVSVAEVMPVQNLGALVKTSFEGRAVLELVFHAFDSASETGTTIETVTVEQVEEEEE